MVVERNARITKPFIAAVTTTTESFIRRLATSYRQYIVDVTACIDISKVSGVSVQVSGSCTSGP